MVGLADEGRYLRAFVEDRGPGLPHGEAASQLFRLFAKGKERGGKAGIGLYFCRITVERWGGTVGCGPRHGGGARFWFRLPRPAPQPPNPKVIKSPENAPTADAKKSGLVSSAHASTSRGRQPLQILLAEDTAVIRKVAAHMLRERGHKVVAVKDGKDALDKLKNHRFDVVLMDAEMPKMNGIDATRAIRQGGRKSREHLRVIAMTAYTSETERQRCFNAGMDGCLAKPFLAEDIYDAVENVPVEPRTSGLGTHGEHDSTETRRAAILARVGGKAKLLGALIRLFLSECPKQFLAIQRAIARGDGKSLASAAHALRGPVALFFGDEETTLNMRRLESLGRRGDMAGASSVFDELWRNLLRLCEDLTSLEEIRTRSEGGPLPGGSFSTRKRAFGVGVRSPASRR